MPPPDRWENYIPLGKIIPKTKLVAFKVPLKEVLLDKVAADDKFSPSILTQKLKDQGERLALIIDLTFTYKYYDKQEFLNDDVMYKKIFVKGHEIPSDKVFLEFLDAIKSCEKEDSVIGVHCTHGVNRTGYLVCRYMIEKLGIDPEEAISLFNEARGHSIERVNYLQDLRTRKPGEIRLSKTNLDSEEDSQDKRKKERWRRHREDHPGWRRNQQGESSTRPGRHHPYPERDYSSHKHGNVDRDNWPPRNGPELFRHDQNGHRYNRSDRGNRDHYSNSGPHGYGQSRFEGPMRGRDFQGQRSYHDKGLPGQYDRGLPGHYDREEHSRYQQAGWGGHNQQPSQGREDHYRDERWSSQGARSRGNAHWGRAGQHYPGHGAQSDHRSNSNGSI